IGLASGDGQATRAFVARFGARIFSLALALVGDTVLAERIAGDTVIWAKGQANGGFGPGMTSVTVWVLSGCVDLAVEALRRPGAFPPDHDTPVCLGVGGGEAAPVFARSSAVRRALVSLPADQRRALVLAGVCRCSAEEVAVTEGVPVAAVRVAIRAGLTTLRGALAAAPPSASPVPSASQGGSSTPSPA
ncbi:MAG: RNA polymerase sigma factor, partial [Sciscionella sp.]